jgi:hypothetical protein
MPVIRHTGGPFSHYLPVAVYELTTSGAKISILSPRLGSRAVVTWSKVRMVSTSPFIGADQSVWCGLGAAAVQRETIGGHVDE